MPTLPQPENTYQQPLEQYIASNHPALRKAPGFTEVQEARGQRQEQLTEEALDTTRTAIARITEAERSYPEEYPWHPQKTLLRQFLADMTEREKILRGKSWDDRRERVSQYPFTPFYPQRISDGKININPIYPFTKFDADIYMDPEKNILVVSGITDSIPRTSLRRDTRQTQVGLGLGTNPTWLAREELKTKPLLGKQTKAGFLMEGTSTMREQASKLHVWAINAGVKDLDITSLRQERIPTATADRPPEHARKIDGGDTQLLALPITGSRGYKDVLGIMPPATTGQQAVGVLMNGIQKRIHGNGCGDSLSGKLKYDKR